MDMKEMIAKTGIVITGICKGVNCYVSAAKKEYWSVDVECKDTRGPVNIKLPEGYDKGLLKDYEICRINTKIQPSFDKKGIELHAI